MTLVVATTSTVLPATSQAAHGWVAGNTVPLPKPRIADVVKHHYVALPAGTQQLGGQLSERFATNLEGRLLHVDEAGLLDGFRQRPGKHAWIGEHIGKFLDAGTRVYRYNKDARLKTLMDRMVKELLATQEADGYMGTYTAAEKWTSWDVWSHKYNLMGLLAYYQTTGAEASLHAAVRIGNLLDNTFGAGKKDLIAAGTHVGMAATSVLGPMVELYRATGDARYLAFCKYILNAYDQQNGPGIVSTLAKTGSVLKTANAKAYEMISNLLGLVKLYEVTGDKTLLDTATTAWKDISENRLYLTGSTSSKEHFQEAHFLPGEIKNNIAETCVTVNWLELNIELLSLSGEAKFADQIEKTVMNHLLAAQDAKNGDFSYYTPLNGSKPYTPGINCCVSSGPRGISMLPELAWGQLDGSPAVTLYTAGKARQTVATADGPIEVQLRAKTDFPKSGNVTFELKNSRSGKFPVFLRVPAWATTFTVSGESQPGTPGTFMRIERNWKTNNKLQVKMDLPVRVEQGGQSYVGRVAVVRGPQVFAMEVGNDEPNPAPALRQLVALQGPLDSLPLALLPKHHGLAFSTPALVWETLKEAAKATKRNITLVPYADARFPQLWLLKEDSIGELRAARAAREAARPHLVVSATKTVPVIDGTPDAAVFKNKTAMAIAGWPWSSAQQSNCCCDLG